MFKSSLTLLACVVVAGFAQSAPAADSNRSDFERYVMPVLNERCLKCHGATAQMAGLDVRSAAMLLKGGDNGPAITQGSAEKSLLFQRVATHSMPPGNEPKLSPQQIAAIRNWIDAGAPAAATKPEEVLTSSEASPISDKDREFWAFRKPARPVIPKLRDAKRVRTPVDAFLLSKLQAKGLTFSPEADRRTLIRRAYFDLTGLPPTPEEVRTFESDSSPKAYDRLIERLLASPHFGERWGRHWLDVAGYVDNQGLDHLVNDYGMREGKWRYRDYVVRAFNQDKPYDRFIMEQIAGDEMVGWRNAANYTPEILDALTATGFLRTASDDTDHAELNIMPERYGVVHQTIQTMGSAVLGLTIGCAKCHSHKYDPIPQRDYYSFMAVLAPAFNVDSWLQPKNRFLADVPPVEKERIDRHNEQVDLELAPLKKDVAGLRKPYEQKLFNERVNNLVTEELRADVKAAFSTPETKRTNVEKYLVAKLGGVLKVKPEEVSTALSQEDRTKIAEVDKRIRAIEGRKLSYGKLQALFDVGTPPRTHLFRRGNFETPGPEVSPAGLSVLTLASRPLRMDQPSAEEQRTSRRLAFAKWVTDPNSPSGGLTARVMANRIWMHLFGEGIVSTPDNFGRSGAAPTHPELLEWLTTEFMESGWRVKPLIRLIVNSSVYRQQSASLRDLVSGADPQSLDPGNRLLWRMPLRRIESESVRDAILVVSGKLDTSVGGPPVPLEYNPDGMVQVAKKSKEKPEDVVNPYRRSLYLFSRRNYNLTLLTAFDQPVMNGNCPRRISSSVVLQSLAMLNDSFVIEQAEEVARRVIRDAAESQDRQVKRAFQLVLLRDPSHEEAEGARDLLSRHVQRYADSNEARDASETALAHLCRMLLNTNEFLYR